MLFQYYYLLSDRLKFQILWCRIINVSGRIGSNVPMDLHMEHLNRDLKEALRHLSSNVNDTSIQRIGKALRKLNQLKENYDKSSEIPLENVYHTPRSVQKDMTKVVAELNRIGTNQVPRREHSQFKKFDGNVASALQFEDVDNWLRGLLKRIISHSS